MQIRSYIGIIILILISLNGCKGQELEKIETMDLTEIVETAETSDISEEVKENLEVCSKDTIMIYICGAVNEPGVYELNANDRVITAVEKAGGMTEDADTSYLNLADTMEDGEKIQVPTIEESEVLEQEQENLLSGIVDLNHASKEELMTLAGVGEAKALDIIAYRETEGGFKSIEEIMEIPGIKEAVFEKIKDQIRVE